MYFGLFVGIVGMGFIVVILFFVMNNLLIVMINVFVIDYMLFIGVMKEVLVYVNVIGFDLGLKIILIGLLVILFWLYVLV